MRGLFIIIFIFTQIVLNAQIEYEIPLKEMSDAEYPDNPNLESRHSKAQQKYFKTLVIKELKNNSFDLKILSHRQGQNEITLSNIPLLEMIPTAPDYVKKDEYLTYITVINQEWNRQQVQYNSSQFSVHGNNDLHITRIDLARNCLNAYLWEILVYATDEDGVDKLFWQCWFDFPKDLYKSLFEKRNQLDYEKFRVGLENWIEPKSKVIKLNLLRKILDDREINFESMNHLLYPLKGERQRKRKNIITPTTPTKIDDFLNDSTQFATFSIPGYYNKDEPRKTELSKLDKLIKVKKRTIIDALGRNSLELELIFLSKKDNKTITRFIIGGIDTKLIKQLHEEKLHEAWQTSMGVSNHSFYETFDYQQSHLTKYNTTYTLLLDEKNRWMDSHKIGIDGPLLYLDSIDKNKLHIMILSFERHAFVGHYIIHFEQK